MHGVAGKKDGQPAPTEGALHATVLPVLDTSAREMPAIGNLAMPATLAQTLFQRFSLKLTTSSPTTEAGTAHTAAGDQSAQ